MSWGFVAVGVGTAVGGYLSAEGAKDAARSSQRGADLATAEQRRQFDLIQELLAPYAEGGEEALNAQRALIGLAGPGEQAAAIKALEQSPQFTSLVDQGEEAILANASATGGLRGGNIQRTLAEFRPQMLSQLIQQQFGNLGGITSTGQNAAAMTGNAGMQTGANISNIITGNAENQGNAQLAQARAYSDAIGNIAGLGGMYLQGKTF
jgi:hypothetical protein